MMCGYLVALVLVRCMIWSCCLSPGRTLRTAKNSKKNVSRLANLEQTLFISPFILSRRLLVSSPKLNSPYLKQVAHSCLIGSEFLYPSLADCRHSLGTRSVHRSPRETWHGSCWRESPEWCRTLRKASSSSRAKTRA